MNPSPARARFPARARSRRHRRNILRVVPAFVLVVAARVAASPAVPSNLPDTAAAAAHADGAHAPAHPAAETEAAAGSQGAPPNASAPVAGHADSTSDTDDTVVNLIDALPSLHDEGLLTLGLGTGLAIASTVAFVVGTDAEHGLLAGGNSKAELDALMTRRLVAASVAWPSLAAAVLAIGGGVTLSTLDILQERSASGPFALDDPPFAVRPRIAAEDATEPYGSVDDASADDTAEGEAGIASDNAGPRDDVDGDAAVPAITAPAEENAP